MGMLAWIVFGLIAGILARLIMPDRRPNGLIVAILLGMAGAVAGGLAGDWLGVGGVTGFDARSFFVATAGALGLQACYQASRRS